MSPSKLLLLFAFFGLAMATITHSEDPYDKMTDLFDSYNLPTGLFPTSSLSSFSFNQSDKTFVLKLERSCYAKLEEELLWYGKNIKGTVYKGRIEELSGVQARQLLVWLPVKGLHVDDPQSGYVYLEIGLTYTRLSARTFERPPQCSDEEAHLFIR